MTGSSQEGRAPTGAGSAAGRGAGLLVRSFGEVTAPAAAGPVPDAYARSPESVLEALGVSADGLTSEEAARRLREFGPNQIQALKPASALRILIDQLRSVVVLLLLVAACVAWLLGDPLDAAAIGAVLVINTLLGFVTELRARRAMEALARMEVPRAPVRRDGRVVEVDASTLVPGDVIEVEAGQSIAADARILEASELRTSEAALTGESLPVDKGADAVPADTPLPERSSMLYKGTTVAAGSGRAVVTATGAATELGRIGGLVAAIPDERTPLEQRLDVLGRRLILVALGVAALVIVIGILQGMPVGQMIEAGIALAIAAVPEGLPAVSTIALAVGVRRMARRRALVRRLPSVETLGSATVICTDKTGTLTAGEMTWTTLWLPGREIEITGVGYAPEGEYREAGKAISPTDDKAVELAVRTAALASRGDVVQTGAGWAARGDPTDAALVAGVRKAGLDRDALQRDRPQTGELPFSSERMLLASFHEEPDGRTVAYVKGAPGRILELCTSLADGTSLDTGTRERLREVNTELATRGMRVLALAAGPVAEPTEAGLRDLAFVGFVGLIDPPASGVRETIRQFREAGIRTVMLTGDQRATATAIARDLGVLAEGEEVLDGRELARLSGEELSARVGRIGVYSRVSPESKLKIVAALQQHGEIVAMLGDGVNDAAALKKANIGVAMGIRGTDAAKEAAALVLADDRFQTIGAAIEEGRVIFDNIRKFVFYLFSCNLAEVLLLLAAGVAGLPLPLLPLQILWLNLITDTFPALALAFEPAEPSVMRQPPRDPQTAILSAPFVRRIGFYSTLITGVTLAAFLWGLGGADGSQTHAVTLSFMTLALAQIFHLGNARRAGPVLDSRSVFSNRYAMGAVILTVGLQLLAVYWAPLARVLHLRPLDARDWLVVLPLSVAPAVIGQVIKFVTARRRRRP
ncbi:MAG TPA: cation-transporting P-type ATPase [Longimicrobiales bacterium]|nr:cation-transporting P-type ATPase [Longimicrobiales bacterium]